MLDQALVNAKQGTQENNAEHVSAHFTLPSDQFSIFEKFIMVYSSFEEN